MTSDFLRIDVDLLLCRYGRQRVLAALAETETCSTKDLEKRLEAIRRNKATKGAKASRKSLIDRLEADFIDRPEQLAAMRPFVVAYENGTLLPSLKAVNRFLESRGEPLSGFKSRKLAGPSVLKALSKMGMNELERLRRNATREGQSDFSLLSQAILRRD